MQGLSSSDTPFPDEEELLLFAKAWEEKGLSNEDPQVQEFFQQFFKDETKVTTWVEEHNGQISAVVSHLDELGVKENRIKEFCNHLLKLKTEKETPASKPIPLEFICDLDTNDHNGAMLSYLNTALENQSPVVTTRSLFRAKNVESNPGQIKKRDELLKELEKNYDFYSKGAFIVFVPKKLGEHLSPEERFAKLDLNEKEVKKVSLAEAWEFSDDQADFNGFQTLFSSDPTHAKQFHLAGHGGGSSMAGLSLQTYQEFVNWIGKQHCKGLLITSCSAGGESSMLLLPKQKIESSAKFHPDRLKGTSFPIFIRSIGDFPTFSREEAEANVPSFFSRITELLNSSGGQTIHRLRKTIQEEEAGKREKEPVNMIQVFFPQSVDSPSGFRPVGEGGKSLSFTFVWYRNQQLSKEKIEIEDQSFVELFPTMIESPVVFKSKNPIILSMIPGKALHLFENVQITESTPLEFLKAQADFYKKNQVKATKVLLFNKLEGESGEISQVFINLENGTCGFNENGQFYLWNAQKEEKPIQVSPFEYLLSWNTATNGSFPEKETLRVATGGQEDLSKLKEQIKQESFWGQRKYEYAFYGKLMSIELIQKISPGAYLNWMNSLMLSESKKISLIGFILPHNQALACYLFEELKLSPNSKDTEGVPLIIRATKTHSVKFLELLIDQGVDLNAPNPSDKNTALFYALQSKDDRMFTLLLSQPSIDLQAKNSDGVPAFAFSWFDLDRLKKLRENDPTIQFDIDQVFDNKRYSLLTMACLTGRKDLVEYFLATGVDPNKSQGAEAPLTRAIINNRPDIVALLLKHGADPYKRDSKGTPPIFEACRRGEAKVVEQLLKEPFPSMSSTQKETLMMDILLEAMASGEEKKVRAVLQQGYSFPKKLNQTQLDRYKHGLQFLHLLKKKELMEEIIVMIVGINIDIRWFVETFPDIVLKAMNQQSDLLLILDQVLQQKEVPQQLRLEILSRAIELDVDLNALGPRMKPLLVTAIESGNLDAARSLIEQGADPKNAAEAIIKAGNIELLKVALENGLPLQSDPPLLVLASRLDLSTQKNEDLFKFLVTQGADLYEPYNGRTPFEQIVWSGDKHFYDFCLKHGGEKLVGQKEVLQKLVVLAAMNPSPDADELVKDLIIRGVDLNEPIEDTYATPFAAIVETGSFELVVWCYERGAKIHPENPSSKTSPIEASLLNPRDPDYKLFKFLVSNGGDINQKCVDGSLPIHHFITNGRLDFLEFCFENGAKLDNPKAVKHAFKSAFQSRKSDTIELLEKRGYAVSDSSWEEEEGADFLQLLYLVGDKQLFEKALSLNLPIASIKKAGEKLIEEILKTDDLKTFQLLKSKGAKFDAKKIVQTFSSFTLFPSDLKTYDVILEIVKELEKDELARFLDNNILRFLSLRNTLLFQYALEHGADPNQEVEEIFEGERPLIYDVIDHGNLEFIRLLIQANVDLNVTYFEKNPIEYAEEANELEIAKYLKKG